MSLTYRAMDKRTDDFDVNVAGASYLYELHKVLGLPVCTETSAHRVPYTMDRVTAKQCATKIHHALRMLGAVPSDQPTQIGVDRFEKENEPTSTAGMALSWAEFLEGCGGYEAE